jgi:hypothetical protein
MSIVVLLVRGGGGGGGERVGSVELEALAHFARRNTRSTDTEMGSSDNCDAHTSIEIAANFRIGFLPLLGEHGE